MNNMKYLKIFKNFLVIEKKHSHKNEYGCIIFSLDIDKDKWLSLLDKIDEKDLYQPEEDPTYGKETEPHVTALYGLHSDISDEDIEKQITKIKIPKIKVDTISTFKNEKFEVLKFDVESKDMHKINKRLRNFPHTNIYTNYQPHITIAYLKKGKSDKYLKLKKDFDIEISHIIYSKADGSKKKYKFTN